VSESALKTYREIAIEPPEDSIEITLPVGFERGIRAWKNKKNDFTVFSCHYTSDSEKCSDEWYTEACKNLRPDQIERELEINFESKAGTKVFPFLEQYPGIFRADPPMPIPPNWKIIVGLDYGSRNPTAITFYAIDEFRRFWAFSEYYQPSDVYKISSYLKAHPYWGRVQYVVADPVIFNKTQNTLVTKETGAKAYGTLMSIAELLMKEGIYNIRRGNNDRLTGLERTKLMFNYKGPKDTKPFLFIGTNCAKGWWELTNIIYKLEEEGDVNPTEDTVKRNDHFFDQLKYSLLSQDIPAEVVHNLKAGFTMLKTLEDEIDEAYHKENNDPYACSFKEMEDEFFGDY